jgi:DNA polymerase III delta prime subunit
LNVRREPENNVRQGFWKMESLLFSPKKILLIGTPGSGKTTVAQRLARETGFPYASIDGCRIRYGDGTVEGEECAWEHFLAICRKPAPGILEFCGMGPHVEEVRDDLLCSTVPVSVIWLVLPLDTCIARASQRQKKIPSPYQWAPVAYSVPPIHEGTGFAWDSIWRSEPHFHATRLEFSGTASVDEMYSAVREICFMR